MKKIYLIRHGQSQSNAGQGTPRPNAEIELTTLGHQQATRVADWVLAHLHEPITAIYVSQYRRTVQTAQPLLDKLQRQAEILPDLHEFNYVSFQQVQNLAFPEVYRLAEHFWQTADVQQRAGDDAESFAEFMQRVERTYQQFCQFDAGTYVVFTHGIWISALKWFLLGQSIDTPKAMQRFHEFEMAIRPKNGDIQLLQIGQDGLSQIQAFASIERTL